MSNAGVEEIIKALESLQEKTDKSLNFLKMGQTDDLIQHIQELQFQTKGSVNNILRSRNGIHNYPCITKVFEVSPEAKGNFPKEKTKDPVTCAKVLYVLYNNYPNQSLIRDVESKAFQCKAQCDICYKLAFEEFFRYGVLQCKK